MHQPQTSRKQAAKEPIGKGFVQDTHDPEYVPYKCISRGSCAHIIFTKLVSALFRVLCIALYSAHNTNSGCSGTLFSYGPFFFTLCALSVLVRFPSLCFSPNHRPLTSVAWAPSWDATRSARANFSKNC